MDVIVYNAMRNFIRFNRRRKQELPLPHSKPTYRKKRQKSRSLNVPCLYELLGIREYENYLP